MSINELCPDDIRFYGGDDAKPNVCTTYLSDCQVDVIAQLDGLTHISCKYKHLSIPLIMLQSC
nr:hypothetical protein [Nitrincola tibetensis]